MEERTCTKCGETKPITMFYKHANSSGRRPDCAECCKARMRKRHADNPDINAAWKVKKEYGLTLEEAKIYWEAEMCEICFTTDPKDYRGKFQIDHCHTTGVVRGALCVNCNLGLGNFKDDVDALKRAIEYLERNSVRQPNH